MLFLLLILILLGPGSGAASSVRVKTSVWKKGESQRSICKTRIKKKKINFTRYLCPVIMMRYEIYTRQQVEDGQVRGEGSGNGGGGNGDGL